MRTKFLLLFVSVLSFAMFNSCKKEEPKLGKINIRLTDAPADLESVNLDLKQVKVHSDESHPWADWVELQTNAGIYDVMRLNNGLDALIASGEFPSGPFRNVRLDLGDKCSVVAGGVTYPLEVPGNCINVKVREQLDNGEDCTLLLDVDLQKSVVYTNDKYVLRPVVHTTNLEESGSIKGKITPVASQPVIFAVAGADTTSAYPNGDGDFLVRGLSPGMYRIVVVPKVPYLISIVPNAEVQAKQVKDVGMVEISQ
jgi:hypothetical protein